VAWPSTPLRTYVANSTPTIRAADLNAMQTGTNGIINATYNLQALVTTTGTPGAVVVPVPGTVTLSGTASATSAPSAAIPWGRMYKESALFGSATIDNAGAVVAVYNVLSATQLGTGQYEVIFNGAPTNWQRARVHITPYFNAGAFIPDSASLTLSGSDLRALVQIYDTAGAPADANFYIDAYGG
jgi:hypothetical protein